MKAINKAQCLLFSDYKMSQLHIDNNSIRKNGMENVNLQ